MRSTSDARSRVIGILVLWAIVFAASFVVPLFIPATCQSFLCGFNRLAYWFWLQVAAFVAHDRRGDRRANLARRDFLPPFMDVPCASDDRVRRDARLRRSHRADRLLRR